MVIIGLFPLPRKSPSWDTTGAALVISGPGLDASGLPLLAVQHKDPMTFAITINSAVFDFNGASLFARFAGREVYITRPDGQPFRMTSRVRSEAGVEFWALGFYGSICRSI